LIPLSESRVIVPSMDISENPIVMYPQDTKPTCVFSSFASALNFLGYRIESYHVIQFSEQFFKDQPGKAYQSMEFLLEELQQNPVYSRFRSEFEKEKISSNHEIFAPKNRDGLRLVALRGSDNSASHAVTVTGQWLFDSNLDFALLLTREGLDDCAGEENTVQGIVRDYHFRSTRRKHYPCINFRNCHDIPCAISSFMSAIVEAFGLKEEASMLGNFWLSYAKKHPGESFAPSVKFQS